jgi:hypothetical protein
LESSQQARMENDAKFGKLGADEALRRRTHILNWLSATIAQVDQDHAGSSRQRSPESGQWLLNDATFQDWLTPTAVSPAAVWMTGIPGSGRSPFDSLSDVNAHIDLRKICSCLSRC